MQHPLPRAVIDRIAKEELHFVRAPEAFFQAWRRGVELAGPEWFGDGSRESLPHAIRKEDLRPNRRGLTDALALLSQRERLFLSAMVSFYDAAEGAAMLRRCGFEGLSDLGHLDLQQRQVIADLLLNFHGC